MDRDTWKMKGGAHLRFPPPPFGGFAWGRTRGGPGALTPPSHASLLCLKEESRDPTFPGRGPLSPPQGGGGGYFFRDSPQRKSKLYPTPPIEHLFGLQTGVFVQRRSGPHRFVPYPHQLRILQFPFQKKWAPLDVNFAIKPNVTFECYSPHA